jgi:hypothetical protein
MRLPPYIRRCWELAEKIDSTLHPIARFFEVCDQNFSLSSDIIPTGNSRKNWETMISWISAISKRNLIPDSASLQEIEEELDRRWNQIDLRDAGEARGRFLTEALRQLERRINNIPTAEWSCPLLTFLREPHPSVGNARKKLAALTGAFMSDLSGRLYEMPLSDWLRFAEKINRRTRNRLRYPSSQEVEEQCPAA